MSHIPSPEGLVRGRRAHDPRSDLNGRVGVHAGQHVGINGAGHLWVGVAEPLRTTFVGTPDRSAIVA